VGFYTSFVTVLICPLLLTVDLGQPLRFWHMMINVTPGDVGPNFKYWSPMSVGVWALLIFGAFATVSAVESLVRDRPERIALLLKPVGLLGGVVGRAFNIVGSLFALFIASYTGVLLSVSNQPIWSDTWTLGGLFLASGLSGSAALMALLTRYRPAASFTLGRLHEVDGYFSLLELAVLVLFFITIGAAGTIGMTTKFFPLWLLALIGIGSSLVVARGHMRIGPSGGSGGSTTIARLSSNTLVVSGLILIGVLALRGAVIFSAQ